MPASAIDSALLDFIQDTKGSEIQDFHSHLKASLDQHYFSTHHGDKHKWDQLYESLPEMANVQHRLNEDRVKIGTEMEEGIPVNLEEILQGFHPWRKGPFEIFGTFIDSEWRSFLKWNRLVKHIQSLKGKRILDIGCGNGYYMLRMLGEGAGQVLGADPTRLFLYQFHIIKKYLPHRNIWLLPLKSEQLPAFGLFDSVFSMGVLYHRKTPMDHLVELRSFLKADGELVLETLVNPVDNAETLIPEDRYAMMANVWNIPSIKTLEQWLEKAGFSEIKTVDVTTTTSEEQRSTPWMRFQSLADFLDPEDSSRTAEGYPAPVRAITLARK